MREESTRRTIQINTLAGSGVCLDHKTITIGTILQIIMLIKRDKNGHFSSLDNFPRWRIDGCLGAAKSFRVVDTQRIPSMQSGDSLRTCTVTGREPERPGDDHFVQPHRGLASACDFGVMRRYGAGNRWYNPPYKVNYLR